MKIQSPSGYLFIKVGLFLICSQLFYSCSSDSTGLQLMDNQIAWFVGEQPTFPKQVRCSWINKDNEERISLTGFTGSEGIMVLVHAKDENIVGEYALDGKNSIMLNLKKEGALAVFLSAACKPVSGKIVITEHDKENNTVSGHFEANLCGKGNFILFGKTEVKEGQFKKVKYLKTQK